MADSVCVRVARFATPTSVNGNTDWTTADLNGLTPVAVMIIQNHADADATVKTGVEYGVGFSDGTNEACIAIYVHDNVTTTVTGTQRSTSNVISTVFDDSNPEVTATVQSFITDGVRLTFTGVNGDAQLYTVIFFAGVDVSAHVDTVAVTSPALDITTPGFEPDLVFALGGQTGVGIFQPAVTMFGACANDGGETQMGWSWDTSNGAGTSDVEAYLGTTDIISAIYNGVLDYEITLSDFDANGFSAERTSGSSTRGFNYLALSFGGSANVWVGGMDTPTTDGDDVQTGPAFKPQFVLLGTTDLPSVNTVAEDGDAGSFGISVFDKDGNEFSNCWADEDAETTTDTQSLNDNQAVNYASDDGAQQQAATFSTMDANGWTLNFSVADGTTRKWWGVAIEEIAAAGLSSVEIITMVNRDKINPIRLM